MTTFPGVQGRRPVALVVALLCALSALLAPALAQAAAPANDNFADAQLVTGASGSFMSSSTGATKEAGEPAHAGNTGGASVWYSWTALSSGTVTIDTVGSSFDTLMGVYTGTSVSTLTAVASNDDIDTAGKVYQSRVSFSAVAGTTYEIAVDGWNGASGTVDLNWAMVSAPANDNFVNARTLSTASGTLSVSSIGATKESGEPNHGGSAGGASVWFSWTAPSNGSMSVTTAGSSFDTLLGVYTGTSLSALTTVASNDDVSSTDRTSGASFSVTAGTTYRIAVDGWKGATGTVSLNWTFAQPSGNDDFSGATTLQGVSGTLNDSSAKATRQSGEPKILNNAGGKSVWYRWTAVRSGPATIDTVGSSFDTMMAIYTGSWSSLKLVGSNDDVDFNNQNYRSRVSFSATAGTTYYVQVDGYNGANGTVRMNWAGTMPADTTGAPVLLAAGDIHAGCNGGSYSTVANLVKGLSGTVAPLGDLTDTGTSSELSKCYDPTWGAFKSRSRPSTGNHDYDTNNAAAYYSYWGSVAGNAGQGWYSYDLGSWHIIVLNSNCGPVGGCGAGSPQNNWLKADLAAHPAACTLAYFHHPLYSSAPQFETGDINPQPLWQALYNGGADVILNAHSRTYERFTPMTPNGTVDLTNGIREFVVGTGGGPLHTNFSAAANSEDFSNADYGVIRMTLRPGAYDWQFMATSGDNFTDSGTGACH